MSAPEPERALQGLEDIRAYLEMLWRRRGRRVTVTRRQVERYVRFGSLPTTRLVDGPYVAVMGEVETWFADNLSATGTVQDVQKVQKVD